MTMTWGFFSVTHIVSLILAGSINVGLYYLLKKRSKKVQIVVLGILSFSGIGAIVFNLLMWNSPLEYLPFHLCSITAILLPIAVFTRSKVVGNLLLLWSIGALFALVVNSAQAIYEIFSWTFVFYYFPHLLELGIPILLIKLGLIKKDYRCIVTTVIFTVVIYTAVHFINVGLNAYCVENQILDSAGNLIQVNYMYSIKPANPLLQFFYNLVPHSYWYMLLAMPIVAVYLGGVYLFDFIAAWKAHRTMK